VRSRPTAYQTVGFLDPDPGKRNRSIHGVRVLGTLDALEETVTGRDVEIVVLAVPRGGALATPQLRDRCEEVGVQVYEAGAFVEMHFAGGPAPAEQASAAEQAADVAARHTG
jgi:FlaA1/EpsC-like NDP-sugar epimerase